MVGGAALAALLIIGAGLVRFPVNPDEPAGVPDADPSRRKDTTVKRPVHYVRLKPGQTAPPGARVIREAAPTPRIVVRLVPSAGQAAQRGVVVRTRQSG